MKIGVFCGSRDNVPKIFKTEAKALGSFLGSNNHTIVYGGVNTGLMGELANAALKENGEVIGISPIVFKKYGILHKNLSELILVDSMHERKLKIYGLSELLIALPGGFGTFEELTESITWNQIGLHEKPIVIFNVNKYYDPLRSQLETSKKYGFISEEDEKHYNFVNNMNELIELIENQN